MKTEIPYRCSLGQWPTQQHWAGTRSYVIITLGMEKGTWLRSTASQQPHNEDTCRLICRSGQHRYSCSYTNPRTAPRRAEAPACWWGDTHCGAPLPAAHSPLSPSTQRTGGVLGFFYTLCSGVLALSKHLAWKLSSRSRVTATYTKAMTPLFTVNHMQCLTAKHRKKCQEGGGGSRSELERSRWSCNGLQGNQDH